MRQHGQMNPSIVCFLGIVKLTPDSPTPLFHGLDSNKAATKTRLEHSRYQGDRHNIWYNSLECVGTNRTKLPTKIAICANNYKRPAIVNRLLILELKGGNPQS